MPIRLTENKLGITGEALSQPNCQGEALSQSHCHEINFQIVGKHKIRMLEFRYATIHPGTK
jgi:hypothetical protein